MKPYLNRILICVIPCLVSLVIVGIAVNRYVNGEGGFRLGPDLVGGTILVYEVDIDKFPNGQLPDGWDASTLAASLKRRIDPNDLYNVTIRPVGNTRIEIILPTGGAHQERIDEQKWQELLEKVKQNWPDALKDRTLDVGRGRVRELAARIEEYKAASRDEIEKFIKDNYGSKRRDVTGEEVQRIKELIAQVGSLEFRILANDRDDREAIEAAKAYVEAQGLSGKEKDDREAELTRLAEKGLPPPAPKNADGTSKFPWSTGNGSGVTGYSWVELGRQERRSLSLDNAAKTGEGRNHDLWDQAEKAREKGLTIPVLSQGLLYSRKCQNRRLTEEERKEKLIEYFLLTRDPAEKSEAITGDYLVNAYPTEDRAKLAVGFTFNTAGGELFNKVTTENKPTSTGPGGFFRHLAILLDSQIVSAPTINSPIRTSGVITGNFTKKEVNQLVNIFRAGALPATLKPLPVSENTIGATLGDDTINAGAFSVILAFVAILVFMLVYYRFAGMVACIALFANLLLTIAFMVLVNATFTLPGLAGLVLMLGMAVDANVLIYERLREERDRGASLALAIRNGYDRAFPTIIDTHLSSIFTAIVLYAVGNDQLKGFGVSLTAGLVISLFTSLYMTRLMFDIGLAKNMIKSLSMFRLLSRTSIDFMRIRTYWLTATVILTLLGITVFLLRGQQGLNIDFVGGTAYGGQLVQPTDISTLRAKLGEKNQRERLKVASVTQVDDEGKRFEITYADGAKQSVQLPNNAEGNTREAHEADVRARASILPDESVEMVFLRGESSEGNKSRFFNVRTSEKSSDLVQVTLDRLLRDEKDVSLLKKIELVNAYVQTKDGKWVSLNSLADPVKQMKDARSAVLSFSDFASPGQMKSLLEAEFRKLDPKDLQPIELVGVTSDDTSLKELLDTMPDKKFEKEGRYKLMKLTVNESAAPLVPANELKNILLTTKAAFEARPQPERLENFDSQLAAKTQESAMKAIALSWAAILIYLWFRFGNWTFGLAAVACLIHDLFFTLGIIAFCHYIHQWAPGFATTLGLHDFKIDLPAIAALLTLVGYSVNDTIVVFDRIREVRGKNPELTPQMINDSVNQTLSRTLLTAFSVFLVAIVLYIWGGEGVHLFAFVMVVGVIIGTYSSIYVASPLLLIFGEGSKPASVRDRKPAPEPETAAP